MEFSANPKAAVLAHVHSPNMQGRREQPRGISTGILEVLEVNPGHIVSSKPAWAIHCDPIKKKPTNKCLTFPFVILRPQ